MCTGGPLQAGPRPALLCLSDERRGFSTMANWTLETISWDRFDASKVDPEILRNIKAAARGGKRSGGKPGGGGFRHYKLFYTHLRHCLKRDRLSRWGRLRIGWGRLAESEDDELAYAYFAANEPVDAVYDRERSKRAYAQRAYPLYRESHVQRGMAMVLKAVGLRPQGRLNGLMTRAGLGFLPRGAPRYAAQEA